MLYLMTLKSPLSLAQLELQLMKIKCPGGGICGMVSILLKGLIDSLQPLWEENRCYESKGLWRVLVGYIIIKEKRIIKKGGSVRSVPDKSTIAQPILHFTLPLFIMHTRRYHISIEYQNSSVFVEYYFWHT